MIIRQLTAFERDAVKQFYLALSQEDRRMRFCAIAKDETVGKYVDQMLFTRAKIIGAFDQRARLIGVAELTPGTEESDLSFAVRADMRGQRIGTKLMEKLIIYARLCGIRKVFVLFLWDNTPMRRLAVRAGMKVNGDGLECSAFRELQAPAKVEVSRWLVQDWISHNEYFSALMNARGASLAAESVTTAPLQASELETQPTA